MNLTRQRVIRLLCGAASVAGAILLHSASAQTQLEMSQTAAQHLVTANRELNVLVAVIRKQLSPTDLKLFQQSQASWYAFRTQDAMFRASRYQGGSLYPTEFASVQASITNQRIAELREIVKNLKAETGHAQ